MTDLISDSPTLQISPATRLGHVHLTVANLDNQLTFYQNVLGMQIHWREGPSAGLGAGEEDLLRLTETPGARRVNHTTGLYHFALLYPSRRELARAIARVFALRYPNYPTDHVVSETTYLDDLEGQTIELYIRTLHRGTFEVTNGNFSVRRLDGKPATGRDPLDLEDLFAELSPDERLALPLPKGTKMGHVHLYAASLEASMHFYHEILGFPKGPVSTSFRMGEVGLSEDHPHVIAFNTWKGGGAPPPPADALGLRYFTIILPNQAELEQIEQRAHRARINMTETENGVAMRDPSQNTIVLTVQKQTSLPNSHPSTALDKNNFERWS